MAAWSNQGPAQRTQWSNAEWHDGFPEGLVLNSVDARDSFTWSIEPVPPTTGGRQDLLLKHP